jgi:hypothetical protein
MPAPGCRARHRACGKERRVVFGVDEKRRDARRFGELRDGRAFGIAPLVLAQVGRIARRQARLHDAVMRAAHQDRAGDVGARRRIEDVARGVEGARGVAEDEDALRVAAVLRGIRLGPAHGGADVLAAGRPWVRRRSPIRRGQREHAALREECKQVMAAQPVDIAIAGGEAAAGKEHQHRKAAPPGLGLREVQLLLLVRAVRQVGGDAHALPRRDLEDRLVQGHGLLQHLRSPHRSDPRDAGAHLGRHAGHLRCGAAGGERKDRGQD